MTRPALGRGLSALIPATAQGSGASVDRVDIDLVVPNPQQPRSRFDPQALQELADSIVRHGLLQPLLVTRKTVDGMPATYQLVAGERRLQAARIAGLTHVPVIVREEAGDGELLELALVENLQRQDLNPIEEAIAFRRLADEFHLTQEEVAQRVGRSRVAITNTVRLLSLEDDIRDSLVSGQISEGHARALLGIEQRQQRLDAWRKIVSDSLTVRQAEEIARALRGPSAGGRPRASSVAHVDADVRAVEDRLRRALGARVAVHRSARGGRIVVTFHSDDELAGILERIEGTHTSES